MDSSLKTNTGAVSFAAVDKAMSSLEASLSPPPGNDRERDGAIQRFEYTFELVWKAAKRILQQAGILSQSPRSVIRDLAQKGWIENAAPWLDFLEARNATSHTYSEKVAAEVFHAAQIFAGEAAKLVSRLKKEEKV